MKLSKLKRDVNSSENGVWVTNAYGDMDLLIAAKDNKKYVEMLRKEMKPYQRTYKTMDDDFFEKEIDNKCIANHVLLGWRNMEDDDGSEIPYSFEKAYELLCDPENVEFRKLVVALADEAEVFRKEVTKETTKKSK